MTLTGARPLLEESVVVCRETGNLFVLGLALFNLAEIATNQGDYATACERYQEVLGLLAASRNVDNMNPAFESIAELAACLQQPRRGVRLFATAAAIRERSGTPVLPGDRGDYDRQKNLLRTALDKEAFAEEWAAGSAMTTDEAIELAKAITLVAEDCG